MKREYAIRERERDAHHDRERIAGEDLLRRHPGAGHHDLVALPELGPHLRRRRQQVFLDAGEAHRELPQQEQQHEDQQRTAALAQPRGDGCAARRARGTGSATLVTAASRPTAPAASELPRAVVGRHVDLDHLEVVGARDHVVRARRPAATGPSPRCTRDVALDAGEAEREPARSTYTKCAGHVVPVPAGRLRERLDRADVLGADAARRWRPQGRDRDTRRRRAVPRA